MPRTFNSKVAISTFVSPDHAKPIDYGITRLQLLKDFGIIRVGQTIWTYSKSWAKNAKSMIHILQREFWKEMKQLIHH